MAKSAVYLDFAASAPLRDEARAAEAAYAEQPYACANPNSLHSLGREAMRALDGARASIAKSLGCGFRPQDVAFTSGGTEANNLLVLGMAEGARDRDRKRCHVIISAIEHDSVLELVRPLKERGFTVDLASAGRDGAVSLLTLEKLLDRDVALVSTMYANNETGAIQPIPALAAAAHAHGALFHTDAVQAYLRVPLELADVDALSITAHKVGGPVGVGALVMRPRTPFVAQSFGGGQESGRRSGTQDVSDAVALAAVVDAIAPTLTERTEATRALAERLTDALVGQDSYITRTIPQDSFTETLPGTVHLLVDGCDSESLVLRLDALGYCVSAGSACSSGSLEPSHVLVSMGIPKDIAYGALRISFDERTSPEDIDSFCEALLSVVAGIRNAR